MPDWLIPFLIVDSLITVGIVWYVLKKRKA